MKRFSLYSIFSKAYSSSVPENGENERRVRVAEGVEFSNGRCAVSCLYVVRHVFVYDSIADLIHASCADGCTSFQYD